MWETPWIECMCLWQRLNSFPQKKVNLNHNTISNTIILATPKLLQTMNSFRSNNLSLKYHRSTPPGCKDMGIGKFWFLAKTQFYSTNNLKMSIIFETGRILDDEKPFNRKIVFLDENLI